MRDPDSKGRFPAPLSGDGNGDAAASRGGTTSAPAAVASTRPATGLPATGLPADCRTVGDVVDRVAAHAKARGCYRHWPKEALRDYLAFMVGQRTLAVAWHDEQVAGSATAWQCRENGILYSDLNCRTIFDWTGSDPRGDSLYLAHIAGSTRRAVPVLVSALVRRFPNWRNLKLYAHRKGVLCRMPPELFERILRKATYG